MPSQNYIQITTQKPHVQQERSRSVANGLSSVDIAISDDPCGPFGVYLHVPFCFHKCHYCDFYSIVDSQNRQAAFTDRLIEEIHTVSTVLQQRPQTIFIGGGTPTLLEPALWQRLLRALEPWRQDAHEFTVEANPETVTDELAHILAEGGVNRVSIGAQSFNPAHLKTLERWHDPMNVKRAIDSFRAAGISRINLDLIFGIPGQTIDEWIADMDAALELLPTHLSCYSLMYEPNTALTMRMRAGQITPIDDAIEAAMYEATMDMLAGTGFNQYEVSAWARPGDGCLHNLLYWTNANWWPLGPSASGHWNGMRWKNAPRLGEYIDSSGLPPAVDIERVDADTRVGEELMLRLRLTEGIERNRLQAILNAEGVSPGRSEEREKSIQNSVNNQLLEWRGDYLRLTRSGLLLADNVLAELV